MRILVTGGAGFIGSAVVRCVIRKGEDSVVNLDKLTYAANPASLDEAAVSSRYAFAEADICDASALRGVFARYRPDCVLNLAAESHVDRSIDGPAAFVQTNILGTYRLLEVSLDYYNQLLPDRRERFRFHHVSTDEVFGSLTREAAPFDERSRYAPRSPYAASKAASDHLVMAWHHTYGLPVLLSNASNNYGPCQFPEKLIPLTILNGLAGKPLPVYGTGENARDWLYVEDHTEALLAILRHGRVGETYVVGTGEDRPNIDVVRAVCGLLDERFPDSPNRPHADLVTFVADRPGHDLRYAIDSSRLQETLGWRPRVSFEEGLRRTVQWYVDRSDWWLPLVRRGRVGERLGLAARVAG